MSGDVDDWYAGLKALAEESFPKRCAACGRVYRDLKEYLAHTALIRDGSGLRESLDDEEHPIVALFRNCICGSTLMDEFNDRRDSTPQGQRRRELFERVLSQLEAKGLERRTARRELLAVLRGGHSPLLRGLMDVKRDT